MAERKMIMKKSNRKWMVEYDFVDTKFGMRAMRINMFKTEAEAIEFASTKPDAVINWLEPID